MFRCWCWCWCLVLVLVLVLVLEVVVLLCLRLEREAVHSNSPWGTVDLRDCLLAAMPVFALLGGDTTSNKQPRRFIQDSRLHKSIKEGVRALLVIIAALDSAEKADALLAGHANVVDNVRACVIVCAPARVRVRACVRACVRGVVDG